MTKSTKRARIGGRGGDAARPTQDHLSDDAMGIPEQEPRVFLDEGPEFQMVFGVGTRAYFGPTGRTDQATALAYARVARDMIAAKRRQPG